MTISFQNVARRYFNMLYEAMCKERFSIQLHLTEYNSAAILLDCGCREGDNTVRMAKQIDANWVIGLDYTTSALKQAVQKGITCLRADLNDQIPIEKDTIDIIVATDVIEHLLNPDLFVKEMFRVLKPSGYLILDTPNLASWHNIFALLVGIQPFSGPNITTMEDADLDMVRKMHRITHGLDEEGAFEEHSELELTRHIVVIAYQSLINLLNRSGFAIEREYGLGYYPLPPIAAKLFERIDIRHTHHLVIKARKKLQE